MSKKIKRKKEKLQRKKKTEKKQITTLLKKMLSDIAGTEAEKLIEILYNKENVNEFLIAKKLALTINQTRNILYKLTDEGLVSFIRTKDKKKGGWYTYFWTLQTEKAIIKYKNKIISELESLKQQLSNKEAKRLFYCKGCDIEYNEENALLNNYTCTECGMPLELKSTDEIVAHIKRNMTKLTSTLNEISSELVLIAQKNQETKEKLRKLEEKKKTAEKRKRKKEKLKIAKKEKYSKKYKKKK